MPKRAAGLTAAKVKTAKPGRYGDGGGLYLLVRSETARFWLFRYTLRGKKREMGLGAAAGDGAVSLADVRDKAEELRRLVRAGTDPLVAREAKAAAEAEEAKRHEAAQARTFDTVAALYIAANEAGWRNPKHRQQWRNTLETYASPKLGKMPVADVATAHVMDVLELIWLEKPETASRVRGRIEAVLDYAKARGWRDGENPARWRGHVSNMLPRRSKVARVEHHAALPWEKIGAFMAEIAEQPGVGAQALRFAILTGARTGEVIGARWSEIDMGKAVWTVPADRMKAGNEHRVPLTAAALAVLRDAQKLRQGTDNGPVFRGRAEGHGLSNMSLTAVLRRMGKGDLTVHGFRSTFRDWARERTNFPDDVAEAALAHTVRDKVKAAYARGDLFERRRDLMDAWAAFCAAPMSAEAAESVPMRAAG